MGKPAVMKVSEPETSSEVKQGIYCYNYYYSKSIEVVRKRKSIKCAIFSKFGKSHARNSIIDQ